jgi:transcriptional regulator with XRE-family HTH domain
MEFHEKLQNLRKQKGFMQKELAEAIYPVMKIEDIFIFEEE